jgi:hypothetical protein
MVAAMLFVLSGIPCIMPLLPLRDMESASRGSSDLRMLVFGRELGPERPKEWLGSLDFSLSRVSAACCAS